VPGAQIFLQPEPLGFHELMKKEMRVEQGLRHEYKVVSRTEQSVTLFHYIVKLFILKFFGFWQY
jgi:hypothetical protein